MGTITHADTAAPAISGALDLDGTEYELPASAAPVMARRNFRATSTGDPYGVVTAHSDDGNPDPRRGHATILPDPGDEAQAVGYSNERSNVVVNPEDPPARPRQGFTGADPARAATMRRPLVMRKFDQAIAHHPLEVLKVEMDGPLAARPRAGLSDIAHGQPFAGGSTGTQRAGVGPGRNSFRILPKPWDGLLVDTGGPAVSDSTPDPAYTAASRQAARGRFR